MNKYIETQVEGLEQIQKKVNKYVVPIWEQTPYYLTLILALAIVGLFQFASVGFNPEQLTKIDFWIPIGVIGSSMFLIFSSTAKHYESKYAAEDKDIQSVKTSINERAKGQSFLKLPIFLANKNIELRIIRWKEILDQKERKLDSKATDQDLFIFAKGSELQKQDNKYCKSKNKIANLRSDEYIKNHIAYMKLPNLLQYTMSMIIADVNIGGKSAFIQDDNKIIARDGFYKVLTRIVFSGAVGTLVITANAVDIGTIIRLTVNIFILIGVFFDGVLLAKNLVNGIIKGRHLERMQVLDEYYQWLANYKEPIKEEVPN